MHRYILVSLLAEAVFGQQEVSSSKGMRIVISKGENSEQYFQDTEGETQSISLLGLMGAQEAPNLQRWEMRPQGICRTPDHLTGNIQ